MNGKWTALLVTVLMAVGCGTLPDDLAGGSTDTETSLVAGVVKYGDTAVAGATVTINDDGDWTDVTDNSGMYEISVTYDPDDPPTYDIKAVWSSGGTDYIGYGQVTVNDSVASAGTISLDVKPAAKR